MNHKDALILICLASIWGGSFLFMRIAVPEFGPIPMIQMRTGVAALCLLPIVLLKLRHQIHWSRWHHYLFVGVTNSALPFSLLGFATIHVSAGYTSLLNAAVPLWSAIVAVIWFGEWLNRWQILGIILGFFGISILVAGKGQLEFSGPTLAILAVLTATIAYGISANYTKRFLPDEKPLVLATMSQTFAALAMLPATYFTWPTMPISPAAWSYVIALGVVCTAIAYILFYGLINRVGPTKTVSVTFLVPIFGMLWGYLFLNEAITAYMIWGCIIILAGTVLVTGFFDPSSKLRSFAKLSRRTEPDTDHRERN